MNNKTNCVLLVSGRESFLLHQNQLLLLNSCNTIPSFSSLSFFFLFFFTFCLVSFHFAFEFHCLADNFSGSLQKFCLEVEKRHRQSNVHKVTSKIILILTPPKYTTTKKKYNKSCFYFIFFFAFGKFYCAFEILFAYCCKQRANKDKNARSTQYPLKYF